MVLAVRLATWGGAVLARHRTPPPTPAGLPLKVGVSVGVSALAAVRRPFPFSPFPFPRARPLLRLGLPLAGPVGVLRSVVPLLPSTISPLIRASSLPPCAARLLIPGEVALTVRHPTRRVAPRAGGLRLTGAPPKGLPSPLRLPPEVALAVSQGPGDSRAPGFRSRPRTPGDTPAPFPLRLSSLLALLTAQPSAEDAPRGVADRQVRRAPRAPASPARPNRARPTDPIRLPVGTRGVMAPRHLLPLAFPYAILRLFLLLVRGGALPGVLGQGLLLLLVLKCRPPCLPSFSGTERVHL